LNLEQRDLEYFTVIAKHDNLSRVAGLAGLD